MRMVMAQTLAVFLGSDSKSCTWMSASLTNHCGNYTFHAYVHVHVATAMHMALRIGMHHQQWPCTRARTSEQPTCESTHITLFTTMAMHSSARSTL